VAVIVTAAMVGWAVGDRVARRAATAVQVRDSLEAARALVGEKQLTAARQKLAEAWARLGEHRAALGDLAAEVEAARAELDRFQQFLDLVDRAHAADAPVPEAAPAVDVSHRRAETLPATGTARRRSEAQIPLLRQALLQYEVLGRDDWSRTLEGGLLPGDQVEYVRATVYQELLRLAAALLRLNQAECSRLGLSRDAAVREALLCVEKAQGARPPTQGFYVLRARCRKALGDEAGAQADRQRAERTAPTVALDHHLRGRAAYDAEKLPEAVGAFEAALRLDPSNYWTLMWLGYSLCDLGQRPEDFAGAAGVFSGCILKRPDRPDAYLHRGLAYTKLRRSADALRDLSTAIELDPKRLDAWNQRGAFYCDHLGQYDKALADFSRAIALDPQYAIAWFNRSMVYGKLGQWAKAAAACSRAVELDPQQPAWWTTRGALYCDHLAQADRAIADFSKAIALNPGHAAFWCNRGLAYGRLGRHDKAIADCSEAIRLDRKHSQAWAVRGEAYSDLRQWDKALADLTTALGLDPKMAVHWRLRGVVYAQLRQFDKALTDLGTAIKLEPTEASAWGWRGAVLLRLNRWAEARAASSKALELNPKDPAVWLIRGNAYLSLGRPDKALADYSKGIELDPKYVPAWFNRDTVPPPQPDKVLARAMASDPTLAPALARWWLGAGDKYFELAQWDKALAAYSRAVELDSKNAWAWHKRAVAYGRVGQWAKSVADCSKALELLPGSALTLLNRGLAYEKLGRWAEALADCSRAVELDPKCAPACNGCAWLLATCPNPRFRDPARAVELAKKAVGLAPKKGSCWNTLGVAHYRARDWRAAVAALEKAMELQRFGTSFDWFPLAVAYWQLGEREKARAWHDKAVQWMDRNNPKDEVLRRFRAEAAELLGSKDEKPN
jgi:tetratricopeptide (TPR) repeat protein